MTLKVYKNEIGKEAYEKLEANITDSESHIINSGQHFVNPGATYSNEDRALDLIEYIVGDDRPVVTTVAKKFSDDFDVAEFIAAHNDKLNFELGDISDLRNGNIRLEILDPSAVVENSHLTVEMYDGINYEVKSVVQTIESLIFKNDNEFDAENSIRTIDEIKEILENAPEVFSKPVSEAFGNTLELENKAELTM